MSTNSNPSAVLQGIEKQLDGKGLGSLGEVSKKVQAVKVDLNFTEERMDDYRDFCVYVGQQSQAITDAVINLVKIRVQIKANKENFESADYKKRKSIIDTKLIERAKEVKALAEVAQKKAAEFLMIHKVLSNKYEAHKDEETATFHKNTGLGDKETAKMFVDVILKVHKDCLAMAAKLQDKVAQIASFGKAVRTALQAAEARPVVSAGMLKKLPR